MNVRERSAGETIGAGVVVSDILACGGSWQKTIAALCANKPNPSETASAEVSLRASLVLFVESLNLFSILCFYLCVELKGDNRRGQQTAPSKSPLGFADTKPPRVRLRWFCMLSYTGIFLTSGL